ncbi:MAG: hypothetical protein ABGX31_05775, partial [bacterium]
MYISTLAHNNSCPLEKCTCISSQNIKNRDYPKTHMQLSLLDWGVLALYGFTVISLGLICVRKAGINTEEYFLAGRSMPWWLLGTSMVATTFSSDTPNLVSDLVRTGGVSQNWIWWAFVITGMCT